MGFKNYIGQKAAFVSNTLMKSLPDVLYNPSCRLRWKCVDFLSDPFQEFEDNVGKAFPLGVSSIASTTHSKYGIFMPTELLKQLLSDYILQI